MMVNSGVNVTSSAQRDPRGAPHWPKALRLSLHCLLETCLRCWGPRAGHRFAGPGACPNSSTRGR
jgi:hypothetical protein